MDWTPDKENYLEAIRINSVLMSDYHKKHYIYYKNLLKYYRIPVIIISGINSVISVGLQTYLEQHLISAITCILALICSIIGSIELFLSIQSQMEIELIASKDFYLLSITIFKTLSLTRENRNENPSQFVEECSQTYSKLFETSGVVLKKIKDSLAPLPLTIMNTQNSSKNGSEESELSNLII